MDIVNPEQRRYFGMAYDLDKHPEKYSYYKKKYGKEFADKLKHTAIGGKGKMVKRLKPMNNTELKKAASVDDKEIPKKIIIRKKTHESYIKNYNDFLNENL